MMKERTYKHIHLTRLFVGWRLLVLCVMLGVTAAAAGAESVSYGGRVLAPETTVIVRGQDTPSPTRWAIDRGGAAAVTLQTYLRKATGSAEGFVLVDEEKYVSDTNHLVLAVGRTRWLGEEAVEGLWRYSFVIRRQDRVISILGPMCLGTLNGVVHFLDTYAGVRFYLPGDLWTSLPSNNVVRIPDMIDIRSEPWSKVTQFGGNWGIGSARVWAARNAVYNRAGTSEGGSHGIWSLVAPYVDEHPGAWITLQDGVRIDRSSRAKEKVIDYWVDPCYTHEDTLDAAEKGVRKQFADHLELVFLSVSVMDGGGRCYCAECCARQVEYERSYRDLLVGRDGKFPSPTNRTTTPGIDHANAYARSQIYWHFLNRLTERVEDLLGTDRFLFGYVYGESSFPPDFELHSQVMLVPQIHLFNGLGTGVAAGGYLHPDPDGRHPLDRLILRNDQGGVRPIGQHEWYQGGAILAPRIYSDYYATYLRYLKKQGVDTFYAAIEAYANLGMDGPKLWVLAQQLWDPDRDHLALWHQFCDDMFGPGGLSMFHYFRTLETWFVEQEAKKGWSVFPVYAHTPFIGRDADDLLSFQKARAYLQQAEKLVETEEQRTRLRVFDLSSRLTEMLLEIGVYGATSERVKAIHAHREEMKRSDEEMKIKSPSIQHHERSTGNIFEQVLDKLIQLKKTNE